MDDDLDPFADILGDRAVKNARVVKKFQPKPKVQPQKKVPAKCSVASSKAVQTIHSSPLDPIDSSGVPHNDSTKQAGLTTDSAPCESSQPIKNTEPLESGSNDVHNDKENFDAFMGKSIEENADILIRSEARANLSPRTNTECTVTSSEAEDLDSPSIENIGSRRIGTQLSQSGPLQPDSAEKDSIHTLQHDAVDLSSPVFISNLPSESISELPLNEESMNPSEVAQLESCTDKEGLREVPTKLASRRAKTGNTNAASDHHPLQQKASTESLEDNSGRSLRPRKRNTKFRELVDEDGDENLTTGELCEERPVSSSVDEVNINKEQPQVENESQKKNSKRKSKKTENDKEKPPRKSKKAKEAEQETQAKKKRFCHSTRRRRVDKNLLDIPEDEFDPTVVCLRDLILLAEHREREEKKAEQPAAKTPATHQSTGEDNDGEGSPIAEDTTEYFNYQSRMEKTPRVRWSKQDTELFYQAVQQFGTDFSMIAQLFDGRSREQIRNKYKKEERQHPLMLRDALTNRCKDLSHFQKVIENLNKIRAKEEENAEKDDLEEWEEERDEGDDEPIHEREEENGDVADESTIKVQSPSLKGEEVEVEVEKEDDDYDPWSQYTSDI